MLKPKLNPFDILNQLPSTFGTNPTPNWILVWNRVDSSWTAADLDSVDDLLEVALDANLEAIATLGPEAVMFVTSHARPDLLSAALHNYAVNFRQPARGVSIADFAPIPLELDDTEPETLN
jgi:hypothetical protein